LKLEEGFKVLSDQLIQVKADLATAQANESRMIVEQIKQFHLHFSSQSKMFTGLGDEHDSASSKKNRSRSGTSADVLDNDIHSLGKAQSRSQMNSGASRDSAEVDDSETCDLDEEICELDAQMEQLLKKSSEAYVGTVVPEMSSTNHSRSTKFRKKTDWDSADVYELDQRVSFMSCTSQANITRGEEPLANTIQKYMIHPQSTFRMAWDILGMIFLIYDIVTIPMTPFDIKNLFFTSMTWMTAFYWTFDIGFSFITGFVKAGKIVMIPRKVAWHYVTTWLLFDVIIVAPEWFSLSLDPSETDRRLAKSWALLRVLRIVRFVRLLRLVKVKQLLDELEAFVDSQLLLLSMVVVKLSMALFLIVHGFACAWYGIGKIDEEAGWVKLDKMSAEPVVLRYITCFQWAMQMFHPSRPRASLHEGTNVERMFELASTMFGLVCSSLFISTVTNTMVTLQAVYSRQSYHRRVIHNYVTSHSISPDLAAVAKQQVRLQIDRISRQMADVELTLLVAKPLLMDMREEARSPLMFKNNFCMLLHERHPRAFRRLCHEAFVEINAFQTEKIFSNGDAADRMFFIEAGSFTYTPLGNIDEEAGTRQLKSGDCLSEAALWVSHWTYHGELEVSSKRSVVLALLTSTFTNVLHHFPEAHADSAIYAEYFVKLLSDVDTADLEFFTPPPAPADEIK